MFKYLSGRAIKQMTKRLVKRAGDANVASVVTLKKRIRLVDYTTISILHVGGSYSEVVVDKKDLNTYRKRVGKYGGASSERNNPVTVRRIDFTDSRWFRKLAESYFKIRKVERAAFYQRVNGNVDYYNRRNVPFVSPYTLRSEGRKVFGKGKSTHGRIMH